MAEDRKDVSEGGADKPRAEKRTDARESGKTGFEAARDDVAHRAAAAESMLARTQNTTREQAEFADREAALAALTADTERALEETEAPLDPAEIERIVGNWEFDDDGNLVETIIGKYNHGHQAELLTREPGHVEDEELAHVMALGINKRHDRKVNEKEKFRQRLEDINKVEVNEKNAANIARIKNQYQSIIDEAIDHNPEASEDLHPLKDLISERERATVEHLMSERIRADQLPWTMPHSELDPEVINTIKGIHEGLKAEDAEPRPDDEFKVAPPKAGEYVSQDQELLAKGGITHGGIYFKRDELQRAGVFFLNRVAAGEQPIFGMPIPDPESEGGVFNVQDRSFLTKEEFEKVYRYQQEHGFGVGDQDAEDVQTDMLMFAYRPEARVTGARKGAGTGGRENKYGQVRSPFVDLGFSVQRSIETYVYGADGPRINTTTLHLANAHPDYPGVSEMFDSSAAHDQRYMSAGEFTKKFYLPPTTRQDALSSMKYNMPTSRERAWVGKWPDSVW